MGRSSYEAIINQKGQFEAVGGTRWNEFSNPAGLDAKAKASYNKREVAKHLRKDPAIITRYLKERNNLKKEAEKAFNVLNEQSNVNNQV